MNIWMNDVRDPTNFATWLLERCITSHQKKKKKISNMHLLGYWSPLIIFIATLIYKSYISLKRKSLVAPKMHFGAFLK